MKDAASRPDCTANVGEIKDLADSSKKRSYPASLKLLKFCAEGLWSTVLSCFNLAKATAMPTVKRLKSTCLQ